MATFENGSAAQAPVVGPPAGVVLGFSVEGARALEFAAVPTIAFDLRITAPADVPIRTLILDVQLQIAARRRGYGDEEKAQLLELFGDPQRWSTTLRTLLWARTTLMVQAFSGEARVELQVPCTYDLEVTAAQYLRALGDGEVPLELLFTGTAFYGGPGGLTQAARIGLDTEAEYRMPVSVWRDTMDRHFPGTAWLRLPRETYDKLCAYRGRKTLPSWESTLEALLDAEPGTRDADAW